MVKTYDAGMYWDSKNECNQFLSDNNIEATCEQQTGTFGGVGEYTTNASTLNKNYYLKHDVVDDIITASYVCFVTDTEHCMQGGNSSYYNADKTLLQGQESWFTEQSGSCNFGDQVVNCYGGVFHTVFLAYDGTVHVSNDGEDGCWVRPTGQGESYC